MEGAENKTGTWYISPSLLFISDEEQALSRWWVVYKSVHLVFFQWPWTHCYLRTTIFFVCFVPPDSITKIHTRMHTCTCLHTGCFFLFWQAVSPCSPFPPSKHQSQPAPHSLHPTTMLSPVSVICELFSFSTTISPGIGFPTLIFRYSKVKKVLSHSHA